jgi:hypothetical protein
MTTQIISQDSLAEALVSSGRSPEIAPADDVYGWLIGSWELDVRRYGVDVSSRNIKGEVHFGWVMEGRAVQDVWIMPRRQDRTLKLEKTCNMYGTTLRVWDASIQAWRVTWINPVTSGREELIGRWSGKDIVQVGAGANGTLSAGCSLRLRRILSDGPVKSWKLTDIPGGWKASFWLTGQAESTTEISNNTKDNL